MIVVTRTRRIDWPRIVANLQRCGMSLADIARALDVTRQSLDNWAREDEVGEPAFWTGAALLVLWSERTGLKWTDAPVRTVPESVSRILRDTA